MSARAEILGRVRTALGTARGTPVEIPRDYDARLSGPGARGAAECRADTVALFTERIADQRATVRHVAAEDLATAVAAALWARKGRCIIVPADLPYGWLAELDGVRVLADGAAVDVQTLRQVDGVVTGCAVAIARTGTIVLDAGRAQGRRMLTFIPGHHLCIVHADQIVGTVPEAIARLDPRRPLTWISGPTATTGVELRRVEGMHGPRTIDVLIVDE